MISQKKKEIPTSPRKVFAAGITHAVQILEVTGHIL